jgi:hypothetical protein
VVDEQGLAGDTDIMIFEGGIAKEDLWFTQSGNDLVIGQVGSGDQVTIQGWYSSPDQQVERLEVAGFVLLSSQIDQLVAAMAAFAPPTGVGGEFTQEMEDDVSPVIAAAWQTA